MSEADSERSTSRTPEKLWSAPDLERVAVTGKDLDGYEVNPEFALPTASHRRVDPASCGPIPMAMALNSAYPATARIARVFSAKDHSPGVSMSLSSFSAEDGKRVVSALRTAAKECETFYDAFTDFQYSSVEVRPDPGYGDESVSLRFIQILPAVGKEVAPVKVPQAVVVVRKGTAVLMFHSFNNPSRRKGPAGVPDAVVKGQMDKLGDLGKSG
ncbi:hypothetical protein OHB54_44105 [Streptomyces sp. NBC_01007]|nr:hypothetical protein OHB54_44105 [Streptomyces sp. NBC_01007]